MNHIAPACLSLFCTVIVPIRLNLVNMHTQSVLGMWMIGMALVAALVGLALIPWDFAVASLILGLVATSLVYITCLVVI